MAQLSWTNRKAMNMLELNPQYRMSDFEGFYDRLIPRDHMLRRLKDLIDYDFVLDELRGKYCEDNGRTAVDPIRLFKYCMLKAFYRLSDRDLVERSKYDMSFKYFLEYLPEDDVISASLLTVFRRERLADTGLLDMLIGKTVALALDAGIIKSKSIIVDATHTISKFHNASPQEALQAQAKLLRKAAYNSAKGDGRIKFPEKVGNGDLGEVVRYCRDVMAVVDGEEGLQLSQDVQSARSLLDEMVNDVRENQKACREQDARTGHKTADSSFFGFKSHLAITQEGIITAAVITSGEKFDGKFLPELVRKSREAGMDVQAVIGDRAYSEKANIELSKESGFDLVSRLHPCVTDGLRKEGGGFGFNKDAGMYVCPAGHMAVSKVRRHNKQEERKENPRMVYYFDVQLCKACPLRDGCYKEGSKSKTYSVSLGSATQKGHEEFTKTDRFKELMKTRYKIEQKNADLKNNYRYAKAESYGIEAMRIQGAMALFCANLKRILRLTDGPGGKAG